MTTMLLEWDSEGFTGQSSKKYLRGTQKIPNIRVHSVVYGSKQILFELAVDLSGKEKADALSRVGSQGPRRRLIFNSLGTIAQFWDSFHLRHGYSFYRKKNLLKVTEGPLSPCVSPIQMLCYFNMLDRWK